MVLGWGLPALMLAVVACVVGSASNYDIWRNLTVGRWILSNHRVPREDLFTFTQTGTPWTDYEWLAEVVFWVAYRLGGLGALSALRALMVWGATLAILAQFRMRARVPPWSVVLVSIPALLIGEFHLLVRPHLWSFLLCPFYLWWVSGDRKGRDLGVALLFAVWANVHSGTMGLLLLAVALLGGLPHRGRLRTIAAAFVGILANPYGWRILLPLVRILHAQTPGRMQVTEWMGLPFGRLPGFWVWVGVSLLLLVVPGRRHRRLDAVTLLGFAALSLKAVRMVPFAVLLSVPGNAEAVWLLFRRRERLANLLGFILSAGAVVLVVAPRLPLSAALDPRTTPEAAASYVLRHDVPGRFYNDMQYGAYLMWRWFPDRLVYMDNRTELFSDLAASERAAVSDVVSFKVFIDRWGVSGAVLDYPWRVDGTETGTSYPLFRFFGWRVVAWDDGGVLVLAPGEGRDSLVAADGLTVLDPFILDPPSDLFSHPDRETLLREITRSLRQAPRSARAWQIAGNIAHSADRAASALACYDRVLALNRKDPDVHARRALALEKLGRYDDALREWRLQARRKLDLPLIWYHMGRVEASAGRPREAQRWLAKAVKTKPEERGWQALLAALRVSSAEDLRREQEARKAAAARKEREALRLMGEAEWEAAATLLREAESLDPTVASIHQNRGACLANMGWWEEAEAELREALLLDPHLGWARVNLAMLLATARGDTAEALAQLESAWEAADSTLQALVSSCRRLLGVP